MAGPTKAELRAYYLEKRNRIEPALRQDASAQISAHALGHPAFQKAGTVLIYVSFGSEVQTMTLLEESLARGKRLIVPYIDAASDGLGLSELRRMDDLKPGYFPKILEPAPAARREADPASVDVALVPGVAFDRQGYRLGMGGGYFDKLFPAMPKAARIGLAFSAQLHDKTLPREPHDVPVECIITESGVVHL